MSLKPGILRQGEGIDEVHWNILGQVYSRVFRAATRSLHAG